MNLPSHFNLLLLSGLLLVSLGCRQDDPPTRGQDDPLTREGLEVVATFSILGDLVHQIGGEHVSLGTLVGPDGDAHTFEPSPQDSVALHDANLVFENGLGFETWLDDLFDASGSTAQRIVVTQSIEAHKIDQGGAPADPQSGGEGGPADQNAFIDSAEDHADHGAPADGHHDHDPHAAGHHNHGEHASHAEGHGDDPHAEGHDHDRHGEAAAGNQDTSHHAHGHHHHGEFDPHAWHTVPNAIAMVTEVAEALAGADPENASAYEANRERYVSELQELDAWVRSQVEKVPAEKRVLVTTHDTFGYFADQYGFRTVTILGSASSEAGDPSAAAVVSVVNQIKTTGVSAVFAENILSPRLTEQIARQAGVRVVGSLYTDALGGADSGGTSYIAMIRHNVQTIVEALK